VTAAEAARLIRPLAEIEREAVERAVEICEGNIPKAAAHLGISPSTLYRKRAAWGAAAE
jgi:two-component system repressor protein LuxO